MESDYNKNELDTPMLRDHWRIDDSAHGIDSLCGSGLEVYH